jgi:hypothetical protein
MGYAADTDHQEQVAQGEDHEDSGAFERLVEEMFGRQHSELSNSERRHAAFQWKLMQKKGGV